MNYSNNIFSKIIFVKIIILFFTVEVDAQEKIGLGFLGGTSYYIGDLNPKKVFYKSDLAFGAYVRYSLNSRLAFRGGVYYLTLKGDYGQPGVLFPQGKDINYRFTRNMLDASVLLEMNFLPYDLKGSKVNKFTPYLAVGLGSSIYKRFLQDIKNNSNKTVFILSLPVGVGVKYKLTKKIRVGFDWMFYKTFSDDIDVVGNNLPINPGDPYAFKKGNSIGNNDWYSFAGVSVTIGLFGKKPKCSSGF